ESIENLSCDREPNEVGYEPDNGGRADDAGRIDAIEPFRLEWMIFQRTAVAGDLADPPGERKRAHDGGDQRGAEDAGAENQASHILAQKRRQRGADLAHAA